MSLPLPAGFRRGARAVGYTRNPQILRARLAHNKGGPVSGSAIFSPLFFAGMGKERNSRRRRTFALLLLQCSASSLVVLLVAFLEATRTSLLFALKERCISYAGGKRQRFSFRPFFNSTSSPTSRWSYGLGSPLAAWAVILP